MGRYSEELREREKKRRSERFRQSLSRKYLNDSAHTTKPKHFQDFVKIWRGCARTRPSVVLNTSFGGFSGYLDAAKSNARARARARGRRRSERSKITRKSMWSVGKNPSLRWSVKGYSWKKIVTGTKCLNETRLVLKYQKHCNYNMTCEFVGLRIR